MKIPNPNNPVFVQKNNGVRDPEANLAGTFGVDMSRRPGKLMPAPRLRQLLTDTDDTDLDVVNAFAFYDGQYWAVSDYVFSTPFADFESSGGFAQDATASSPALNTAYSDMVVFNDQLIVSDSTDLSMYNGTTWNNTWFDVTCAGNALTSAVAHPLAVVHIGTPMLCIGDGYFMNTVVGTTATDPRLTIDTTQRIRWIVGGNSRVYIGTMNITDRIGHSYVYEWDGGDTLPTRAYKLESTAAMSGTMHEDVLYVVDATGALLRLEGNGFKRVGQFPVFNTRYKLDGYDTNNLADGFMGHKGMISMGGKVLILINTELSSTSSTIPEYSSAGVWEFDPRTESLSHKFPITMDKDGSIDFGQRIVSTGVSQNVGALFAASQPSGTIPATILASCSYYTGSSATAKNAIYCDDAAGEMDRRARIITRQVDSPELTSAWKIRLKYQQMKNAGDRIVVKYRVQESGTLPLQSSVTWTDADTFTSTSTNFASASVGDEIEVVQGEGGGCTAHITSITYVNPTYTVEIDESIVGITGSETGKVRIHNWKKLDSFNDQLVGYRDITVHSPSSTWIQVVVELRGDGGDSPVLEEIDIIPSKQQ